MKNSLRVQARIVSDVLRFVSNEVKPGVTTRYLDDLADKRIKEFGAESYSRNYKPHWAETPFPAVLCTSINEEIAHGIPSERVLKEGDIISLDLGIKYKGYCGDAALTVGVGKISNADDRLLRFAKQSLLEGITRVKAGIQIREVSEAIEKYALLKGGYNVNRDFTGHGIYKEMHENPSIPHTTSAKDEYLNQTLKAGQVVCIEPMLTKDEPFGGIMNNGWTVRTLRGKKSAFFEHMILVKEEGFEILTNHI